MSYNWWPNSLLIGQAIFLLTAVLMLLLCGRAVIVAVDSSLRVRVISAFSISAIYVAFCAYAITVIQIHKHDPAPGGWSIQTGFFNLNNGSSIGTLNGSNNSLVDGGSGSGKVFEIDNSHFAKLKVEGWDSCVGGIEDWPCFVILEESRIQRGDRSGFEQSATNFEGIVRLRLRLRRLSGNQDLAVQCFTEFNAEVAALRKQFDRPSEHDFYNALSHRPVCLEEPPKGAHK